MSKMIEDRKQIREWIIIFLSIKQAKELISQLLPGKYLFGTDIISELASTIPLMYRIPRNLYPL